MPKARLRTKSGCSTCRSRKVKCGEEKPTCRNCVASGRECAWPSSSDLQDRRFRGRRCTRDDPNNALSQPSSCNNKTSLMSWGNMGLPELEHELTHHFLNVLVTSLLLPTVTEADLGDYGTQVFTMMMESESVKYAVLANCASNKYMLTHNGCYRNAALSYYLRAIESVNRTLPNLDPSRQSPGDPLLTTVVYLYLYNFWGPDTSPDARNHVDGAMALLKLRYADEASPMSMARPLHRVTTESVLYQAFLLAIRNPFAANFHVDKQFLDRSEDMLNVRDLISALPEGSSLVLGLPLQLYRLITDIIDCLSSPNHPTSEITERIKEEMKFWEELILSETEAQGVPSSTSNTGFQTDALTLFVLGASLLLDHVTESSALAPLVKATGLLDLTSGAASPTSAPRWQVQRAFAILRRPDAFETWTRCYLGAWPMMILGYSVSSEEDITLIRGVLLQMRDRMGYGEIQRILDDLEALWAVRRCNPEDFGGQDVTKSYEEALQL